MFTEWGVIHFTQFVLGTIGIILLPGPNSLFVLTLAVQNRNMASQSLWRKVRLPVCAALGIMVGDFILVTIAMLGAASVMQKYPPLFEAVKYMGAAYLAYVAAGMLKQAFIEYQELKKAKKNEGANKSHDFEINQSNQKLQPIDAFKTALGISLLNPKAIFFFIAFFIQFLKPGFQPFWLPTLILILVLQCISMTYLSSLIFWGSKLIITLQKYRYSKVCGFLGVACLFFYFSVQLLLTSMHH